MKTTYIALGVIIFGLSGLGALVVHNKKQHAVPLCPLDVMMCPDGTSVPRTGKDCEFGICKQTKTEEEKVSVSTALPVPEEVATTSLSSETKKPTAPPKKKVSILTKIITAAKTSVTETSSFIQGAVSLGVSETKQAVSSNNQIKNLTTIPQYIPSSVANNSTISEVRYDVINNTILGNNNSVIYTIPASVDTSSSTAGWETHTVNVVPVNTIAPLLGAIPVTGLPGKYYLSVNSFGNIENCEFSNKIYILDTNTGERVLMYEENNQTLLSDDPRACNSEMYLLATDQEKLILKYHTIGTNMTCESTWSEPEKTWYLDVTNLAQKTKRYIISTELYTEAEGAETICRANLTQP